MVCDFDVFEVVEAVPCVLLPFLADVPSEVPEVVGKAVSVVSAEFKADVFVVKLDEDGAYSE